MLFRKRDRAVEDIDPAALSRLMQEGRVILVDVREADERVAERIDDHAHVSLSSFDPSRVPTQDGATVAFYCVAGVRSRQAGETFAAARGLSPLNLAGGIRAWKDEGLPTLAGDQPSSR